MNSSEQLRKLLRKIDGKGYKAYKELKGVYDFRQYYLFIDHVQADPFASPSRVRIRVHKDFAKFPKDTYRNKSREIALRDYLTRKFAEAIIKFSKGKRGSGKSGLIGIAKTGQEILERTSVFVSDTYIEVRFTMGLPAHGRRILGKEAEEMFFKELPEIIRASLFFENLNKAELYKHIEVAEDADYLRGKLRELGLVAFVADGTILPRASGVDPRPLKGSRVVPFESPPSLRVEIELPNMGLITGMGIPRGVTLIVGGGYHGKSTLLRALELGIYNHIPGDGREFVVTNPNAVKIRAEDGRRIEKVDISPFINNLPFGEDTSSFSTEDASGSTSQAANIIEALEIGAELLLIDEDTSATNFMIRDHRMQELLPKEKEPITPFIDKVRQLYQDLGVSTIIVTGGCGDYFDIADCVICMVEYKPHDLSQRAKEIAQKYKEERKQEGGPYFGRFKERIPLPQGINPKKGRKIKISPEGIHSILFGRQLIDLSAVEQLVDINQTHAIASAIYYAKKYMDGKRTLREVIDLVMDDIRKKGLDVLSSKPLGDYAIFRKFELASAMNRLRSFSVRQKDGL